MLDVINVVWEEAHLRLGEGEGEPGLAEEEFRLWRADDGI
jgi:hypothetical protein